MTAPLLVASEVTVAVSGKENALAVRGVDLDLDVGETLGLVGESGCGKTLTAYSLMGLLPPGVHAMGTMTFSGTQYPLDDPGQVGPLRGSEVAIVSQDPLTALNPVARIGHQMDNVMRRHLNLSSAERRARTLDLLDRVGIPSPRRVARAYPFELSGGMRQRVLIAMAISCRPKLLIADEPTTALDTTVQAQIMELLGNLVADEGLALLLITHDLGLVAEHCARVAVMYAGAIVERGIADDVLRRPVHPYARALVECVASLDAGSDRLVMVEGSVPALGDVLPGCRFAPRCGFVEDICRVEVPELRPVRHGGEAACVRADELPFTYSDAVRTPR